MGKEFSQPAHVPCGALQGSVIDHLLFFRYIDDTSQTVKWNIFLYAYGSCLVSQQEYTNEIKKQLNKDSENIFDWFADSIPSTHLGDDKTKPIVFATK